MDKKKMLLDMAEKCGIFYDDLLISSEDIIENYLRFFSAQFNLEQKVTSFAFHTGSLCFDVASVAALMLACFVYNLSSNEDILKSLSIGDMVLFKGERYRWNGITTAVPGLHTIDKEYVCLIQDGKGKNGASSTYIPYDINKAKIRPYFGDSVVTDGRGIRRNNNNRNEFLSYVLEIPESDVPSTLNVSVVVIADKNRFIDICQHLYISYKDEKKVQLTDIVPVSYFTESGEEMQIGQNLSKAEAVIKAVSKVSVARDLILDKHNNKVVGLLAINAKSLSTNASDFKDLLRRKTLRFAIVTSVINSESSNIAIEQYDEASIFACTRDTLSDISTIVRCPNKLTTELSRQVRNIIGRDMETIEISDGLTWEEYKKIKNNIYMIRQSSWDESEKEEFVLSALALINLFTSAFFSMERMEYAISQKLINTAVLSPAARIQNLRELALKSLSMKIACEEVIGAISSMYNHLYTSSAKENRLQELLSANRDKKIALVVPKAYYVDLYKIYFKTVFPNVLVTCCTANRFDQQEQYDLIIVVGDVVGKRFDPIQCYASSRLMILLYECEKKIFKHRKRLSEKNERKLTARAKGLKGDEYERAITSSTEDLDEVLDESIREFANLDEFVANVGMFDIRRLVSSGQSSGNYSGTAEVNYIGTFTSGEQILFSKYYTAVVFDRMAQKVVETSPDKLLPGDVLVFTKRNDYTRNIVDLIFEQLLQNRKLAKDVQDAAEKAMYWKKVLRKYKIQNNFTYREIAEEMKKLGGTLQEVSIRQWLDEESHIVGPRKEDTMLLIARLTDDEYLKRDPKAYFEACRLVRHYRREILNLIAQAINDKLSNKKPEKGSVFEVVYDHVEHLSETMELERIFELEETAVVSNSLINRPIIEMEVLL